MCTGSLGLPTNWSELNYILIKPKLRADHSCQLSNAPIIVHTSSCWASNSKSIKTIRSNPYNNKLNQYNPYNINAMSTQNCSKPNTSSSIPPWCSNGMPWKQQICTKLCLFTTWDVQGKVAVVVAVLAQKGTRHAVAHLLAEIEWSSAETLLPLSSPAISAGATELKTMAPTWYTATRHPS